MDTFFAGVSRDTNRIVSSSKTSWANIASNNFFRIKGEANFYEIAKLNEFCYLKEAEIIGEDILQINEDVGPNLLVGDEILIRYSIYEFITVFKVTSPGAGYRVGDNVKLDLLEPTQSSYSGDQNYTSFQVFEVDGAGGIVKFSILKKGSYHSQPKEECPLIGGRGNGAKFICLFQPKISSDIIDREILHIDRNIPSKIKVQGNLPKNIKNVNITSQKWEMFLTSSFNQDIYDAQYEIIKDFTTNYSFPLLLQGSFSKELVFNRTITLIDLKIKQLDDRIKKLESLGN